MKNSICVIGIILLLIQPFCYSFHVDCPHVVLDFSKSEAEGGLRTVNEATCFPYEDMTLSEFFSI